MADNGCGNIQQELSKLKRNGLLFRHETIGLEVASGSGAAKDLNKIAETIWRVLSPSSSLKRCC
jgi:hypothetical protein